MKRNGGLGAASSGGLDAVGQGVMMGRSGRVTQEGGQAERRGDGHGGTARTREKEQEARGCSPGQRGSERKARGQKGSTHKTTRGEDPYLHGLVHGVVDVAQERHRHGSREHRLRRLHTSHCPGLPEGQAEHLSVLPRLLDCHDCMS